MKSKNDDKHMVNDQKQSTVETNKLHASKQARHYVYYPLIKARTRRPHRHLIKQYL